MRRLVWACASSDDFVVPAALSAAGRLLWVAVVAALLYFYRDAATLDAACAEPVTAYLSVSIAVHAVGFLLDLALSAASGAGSLRTPGRRKHVPALLALRALEAACDVVIAAFGVTSSGLVTVAAGPSTGSAGGLACLSADAAASGALPPGIAIEASALEAASLRRALLAASIIGLIVSGSFLCCLGCCAAVCRKSRPRRSGSAPVQPASSSCSYTLASVLRCFCRGAAAPPSGAAASPYGSGLALWGAGSADGSSPAASATEGGLAAAKHPLLGAAAPVANYDSGIVASGSKAAVLRAFAATLTESMEPLFTAGFAFSDVAAGLKLVRARQTAELEAAAAASGGSSSAAVSYSGGPQTPLAGSAAAGGPPLAASLVPLPAVTGNEPPFRTHMPDASWWWHTWTPSFLCSCLTRRMALGLYRLRAYWYNELVGRLTAAAAAGGNKAGSVPKVPRFAVRDLSNSVPLASPALSSDAAAASIAALEDATHFGWYALSAYGWPLYVLDNVLLGVCKLTGGRIVLAIGAALRLLAAVLTCRRGAAASVIGGCSGGDPCCWNPVARTIWLASAKAVAIATPAPGAERAAAITAGVGTLASLYAAAAPSSTPRAAAAPVTPASDPGVVTSGSVSVAIAAPASPTAAASAPAPVVALSPTAAAASSATSVLHASYHNRIFECPYFVAREARGIVVSIRGTMSLEDACTDVVAKPVPLGATPADSAAFVAAAGLDFAGELGPAPTPETLDEQLRVHAGMWVAAQVLVQRLQALGVVPAAPPGTATGAGKDAPAGNSGGDALATLVPAGEVQQPGPSLPAPPATTAPAPQPPVIVVGHSLGAGVAALTSLLLRPLCPTVRCFAYAPPAALVSPPLSRAMVPWVTSVLRGHDLVPRMSLPVIRTLLVDAVQHVEACNSHKATVLGWNPVWAWQLKRVRSAAERYARLMAGTVAAAGAGAVGSGSGPAPVVVASPLAAARGEARGSGSEWARRTSPSKSGSEPADVLGPVTTVPDVEAPGAAVSLPASPGAGVFTDVALTSPSFVTPASSQEQPGFAVVPTAGGEGEAPAPAPASAAAVAAAVAATVADPHAFTMQVPGRVMLLVRAGAAAWGGILPTLFAVLFGWWAPGLMTALSRGLAAIPSPLSTLLCCGLFRRRRSLHIPVWAPYSALAGINISWTMFSHHLPHTLLSALTEAVADARLRAAVAADGGAAVPSWQ